MRFSKTHSRSAFDWNYKLENGRHVLTSNGGVRKRCGLVVYALGKLESGTKSEIVEFLNRKYNAGYIVSDMTAVMNQLIRHEIVCVCNGVYSLYGNGAKLWKSYEKSVG